MPTIIDNLATPPENVTVTLGDNALLVGSNMVNFLDGGTGHTLTIDIQDSIAAGVITLSIAIGNIQPRFRLYARAGTGGGLSTEPIGLLTKTEVFPIVDQDRKSYAATKKKEGYAILTFPILEDITRFVVYFSPVGSDGAASASAHAEMDFYYISYGQGADPYSEGGTSYPAGGDGTFDFTSTDIPIPSLPTISAVNTGFVSLYNPSASNLRDLAQYMWSGAFDPDNFKKIMADPMDAILGLHIIPVISGHPTTAASSLFVGNISTGISMYRFTEQYYALDCGTINVLEKWGAYLDYSPYTKLQLYLPYIGYVPLKTDDVMGGSIGVTYHVDIVSGAVAVFVYCTSKDGFGHVLYSYTGACACDVPVTEGQYTNAVLGILQIAQGVGQMVGGFAGGGIGGVTGGLQNAANAAISMSKPDIGRSGSFGGSSGLMGIQYPYLILEVPRMCTADHQNVYLGYPSFMTVTLENLTGYNEVSVNHLENVPCTAAEAEEIVDILQKGVIF